MSLREYIPDAYRELLASPVAILGVGASGNAVRDLLGKLGTKHTAYDEHSGEDGDVRHRFDEAEAKRHRLVIHSPAFSIGHPWLAVAEAAGCEVVSEIDFAQQLRRGPTIVITGTNGKTTLQEFITFSLKRSGISAMAVGHNHYPLSRLAVRPDLEGVTAVCELGPRSAGPLKAFRFDALFWTNFHEDHLNDEEARQKAFAELLRLSSLSPEALLYFGDSVFAAGREMGFTMPARARRLEPEDYPRWELPERTAFATNIHRPALALYRRYWLEKGYSDSLLKGAAENFEVRAHRLHVLTVIGKTVFWNDSKASNFAATEAALSNFAEPVVWIGGGHYRGGNLEAFAERLLPSLRAAVVIGDVQARLKELFEERHLPVASVADLRSGVDSAFAFARGTSPVVFSPGFIAGEEYGNFMERGTAYENAVFGLKHQKGSV
ncbi:MAG: Mur ligase family protein [Oceanipulchritudo sp.]